MPRPIIDIATLQPVVEDALGSKHSLSGIERLRSGTKKGVYRLSFADGLSIVLYVWHSDENFWPAREEDLADPLCHASSSELFEATNHLLSDLGVPTPRIVHLDREHLLVDRDFALVEDVRGSSLSHLLTSDPNSADNPMSELKAALETMGQTVSGYLGKVRVADDRSNEPSTIERAPQQLVLERALLTSTKRPARSGNCRAGSPPSRRCCATPCLASPLGGGTR